MKIVYRLNVASLILIETQEKKNMRSEKINWKPKVESLSREIRNFLKFCCWKYQENLLFGRKKSLNWARNCLKSFGIESFRG